MLSRVDDRPFANESLVFGFAGDRERSALVVESDFGVAGLLTGGSEETLIRKMQRRFAGAVFDRDEIAMRPTLDAVDRLLADPDMGLPLALDLRGSHLDIAVWQALRQLLPTRLLTIREFLQTSALPLTAHDVERACDANPIEIVIPCHRLQRAHVAARAA